MQGMGKITPDMVAILTEHVRDQVVWDLGAGIHLGWCPSLLKWGASRVVAVEKEAVQTTPGSKVTILRQYFNEVTLPEEGIDVAFLSWPTNRRLPGLVPLLEGCRKVIYLGCNYHGSACGDVALYKHLHSRAVLGHVEIPQNTMTVYGDPCRPREPTHEEWCGITGIDKSLG